MRWIQWTDRQHRWCKPHRVVSEPEPHSVGWGNHQQITQAVRIACGSQLADLQPSEILAGPIYDSALPVATTGWRPRTPEEMVWKRTEKTKNGVTTVVFTDPLTSWNRYRVRYGEVAGPGPGLCKNCNWTTPDAELVLKEWRKKYIGA